VDQSTVPDDHGSTGTLHATQRALFLLYIEFQFRFFQFVGAFGQQGPTFAVKDFFFFVHGKFEGTGVVMQMTLFQKGNGGITRKNVHTRDPRLGGFESIDKIGLIGMEM
jgi:hypothetical protein